MPEILTGGFSTLHKFLNMLLLLMLLIIYDEWNCLDIVYFLTKFPSLDTGWSWQELRIVLDNYSRSCVPLPEVYRSTTMNEWRTHQLVQFSRTSISGNTDLKVSSENHQRKPRMVHCLFSLANIIDSVYYYNLFRGWRFR